MSVITIPASRTTTDSEMKDIGRLAAELRAHFAAVQPEDVNLAIAEALGAVSVALGVESCRLIEFTDNGTVARVHAPAGTSTTVIGRHRPPAPDDWLVTRLSRGQIVVISSVAGLTGVPLRTAYSGSKHAVFGLFESLRIEVAEHGVSVTMIAPDFVQSEIHVRAYGPDGAPVGNSTIAERVAMPADQCASLIVGAMERRQRLLITSLRGRLGRFVRLVAPRLIDAIAYRAIRRGV